MFVRRANSHSTTTPNRSLVDAIKAGNEQLLQILSILVANRLDISRSQDRQGGISENFLIIPP
jgi:hypothetical protein